METYQGDPSDSASPSPNRDPGEVTPYSAEELDTHKRKWHAHFKRKVSKLRDVQRQALLTLAQSIIAFSALLQSLQGGHLIW